MKSINKYPFIAAIILLFAISCNQEKDEVVPKPYYEDENTLVPHTTKIISSSEWKENFKEISEDSTVLTFDKSLIEKSDIRINDVIVINEGDGLIKKVKSISESGDKVSIKTEQAALTDVFVNLDAEKKITKDELEIDEVVIYEDGVKTNARIEKINIETNTEFRIVIADADNDKKTTNDQVILEGNFNQVIDFFDLKIRIRERKLKYFKVANSINYDNDIKIIYGYNEKIEWKKRLVNIKFHRITFVVGGVPIIIRPQFYLKVGAEVEGEFTFWAGVEYGMHYEAGVEYEDGEWSPHINLKPEFKPNLPNISFGAKARAYFEPRFALKLYGIVGPYLSGELYSKLEANPLKDPWLQFILGLNIDLGVEMKILNGKISLDEYWRLYSEEKVLHEEKKYNNPPTATFTFEPERGNINTTYVFDASGSNDPEDGKEGLKYRWDWESDGVWDTEYLLESSIEHKFDMAGSYTVSLEATDKENQSSVYSANIVVDDVPRQLIAYYPFNGNANDESGNGYDATVNGATPTTDRFGNANSAYSFDGTNDYIEIPKGLILEIPNSDFTYSLWINPSDVTNERYIVSFQEDNYGSVQLRVINNKLELRTNQSEAQWTMKIASSIPVSLWSLVTVTYSTSTGWNLYLDADNVGSNSNNGSFLAQTQKSYIGAKPGPENFFNGIIDDVRIYNYAIDEQMVNELYTENGWTGNDEYFTTEFIDFNDNTYPSDWVFKTNNSADISNGRINVYINDGGATLKKIATVSPQTQKIILEMDGYMAYSYWGLYSNFLIVSENSHLKFRAGIEDYDNPSDVLEVSLGYSDVGSPYQIIYDNNGIYKNGTYHLTLEITPEGYKFIGKDPDDAEAFNYFQASENLISLSEITEIWYHVEAHTDNNSWIDNVSIKVIE